MAKIVNILGYDYCIHNEKTIKDLDGSVGRAHFDLHILEVASDMPESGISSTLLHEIIEAVNYHLELNLTHPQIMGMEVGLNSALASRDIKLSDIIK